MKFRTPPLHWSGGRKKISEMDIKNPGQINQNCVRFNIRGKSENEERMFSPCS